MELLGCGRNHCYYLLEGRAVKTHLRRTDAKGLNDLLKRAELHLKSKGADMTTKPQISDIQENLTDLICQVQAVIEALHCVREYGT